MMKAGLPITFTTITFTAAAFPFLIIFYPVACPKQFTDLKKSKAAVDSLQKTRFVVMVWDLEWHYDHKELTVKNSADDFLGQIDRVVICYQLCRSILLMSNEMNKGHRLL